MAPSFVDGAVRALRQSFTVVSAAAQSNQVFLGRPCPPFLSFTGCSFGEQRERKKEGKNLASRVGLVG